MISNLHTGEGFFGSNGKDEPLVSLFQISEKIQVYPYYFYLNIPHALPDCYLRAGAAKKLLEAAKMLPAAYHFVVLDGFRPIEVQKYLYEKLRDELIQKGGDLNQLAKYVAIPSEKNENISPHLTGGAVDLTIANQDGWLNMGTDFDEFVNQTRTDWYENLVICSPEETKIRNHRRLLKQVMEEVGFVNYKEEWWHFDYGNQNWAQSLGRHVIYQRL